MKKGQQAKSKTTVPKSVNIVSASVTSSNDTRLSVRKISNGYVVSKSGTKGTGKNQKWFDTETFTPTNPVQIKLSGKAKGK